MMWYQGTGANGLRKEWLFAKHVNTTTMVFARSVAAYWKLRPGACSRWMKTEKVLTVVRKNSGNGCTIVC